MAPSSPLLFTALSLVVGTALGDAITAAPIMKLVPRQLAACGSLTNIESSCEAATPGFTNLDFTAQVSCYCFKGGRFVPSSFDNAFSGCLNYLSTAAPDVYTSLGGGSGVESPCATIGAVLTSSGGSSTVSTSSATASSTSSRFVTGTASTTRSVTSRTTTTSSGDDAAAGSACATVSSLIASCGSQTPGFSSLAFSSAAECLCYADGSYEPHVFDDPLSQCESYVRGIPSLSSEFSDVLATTTPCQSVGNVLASDSTATSTRRTSTTPRSTSASTATATTTSSPLQASRCSTDATRSTCGAMAIGANVGKSLLVIQVVQVVYMFM